MTAKTLSPRQLKTLLTLYGMRPHPSFDTSRDNARGERLAWASENLGRPVSSFKELRGPEAGELIELLKRSLGQEVKPPQRRPLGRDAAMAAGTHGRRGRKVKVQMLAALADVEEIERLRERTGMTRQQFDGWLRSRSSPLGGRMEPKLLTISDCNRVRWALKSILKRAGVGSGAARSEEKVSAVK
jgi:hypothetical protein